VTTRQTGEGLAAAPVGEGSLLGAVAEHDLRHTHTSILLKQGTPVKVVAERLGHPPPAFTMAVYQHVIPGMQAEAARAFAALIDADGDLGSARSP